MIVAVCHQLNRARAQLQDSLERLTLVQSDVGIGLWTLDLATRQLRTSESGWRLHGRDVPRLAGRAVEHDAWLSVVHPDDRAGMVAHLDAAIASGEGRYEHEFRVPLPDGSTRWINVFVKIHRDGAGRATHLSGAAVDVTSTRALRQAHAATEAQLRIISDSLPTLIAYATPDRRYRFNSRAYETWFGTSPESLAGRPMEDVLGAGGLRRASSRISTGPTPARRRGSARASTTSASARATSRAPTCRTSSTARCRAW